MEVLASRVLAKPNYFEASRRWYTEILGLRVAREFPGGVVFFLGGGFLELSGSGSPLAGLTLWLQVPDVSAEHDRLSGAGVTVLRPPKVMPWGLRECWIAGPDGERIALIEVPEDHPLRRRD